MELPQLLERFKLLSRDIQNGFQSMQKQLENPTIDNQKIKDSLANTKEAWDDFSGWILISTLDNIHEARMNSVPGKLDLTSKVVRSKKRKQTSLTSKSLKIDITNVDSIIIETYISYFEQLLDLLIDNAIKYSPVGGTIEIYTTALKNENGTILTVESIGPSIQKYEASQLGNKGFRGENAKKINIGGQGYGLFNCKKIAELLGAEIKFNPNYKILNHVNNVQYSSFIVSIH